MLGKTTGPLLARQYVVHLFLLVGLVLSGLACPGTSGRGRGTGNGNGNGNTNGNQNANSNGNDNLPDNTNDNAPQNENDNNAVNENDNLPENDNDNVPGNQNDNLSENENDNVNVNVNDNIDNVNVNDNTPPEPQGLPPENERSAFQSQCAQNVITCTTSFPVARIGIVGLEGQFIVANPSGFRVEGSDGDGVEPISLIGSGSAIGDGATQGFFSWSFGAADPNACTLVPGEEFSTEVNVEVLLRAGFHYIRLSVRNDLPPIDSIDSETCGTFENYLRLDFEEIEVEVVD